MRSGATPADLGSVLTTLSNAVNTAYTQWSTAIFLQRLYRKPHASADGSLYTYLEKLMENGSLLNDAPKTKQELSIVYQ